MYTFTINENGTDIRLHIKLAKGAAKASIIYFHGGGLLFGTSKDLSAGTVQKFTHAGYHFISVEYKLAPETRLEQSYPECLAFLNWFAVHFADLGITSNRCVLFGRSAGAYLALLLATDPRLAAKPDAVLSFYGYSFISSDWFRLPSPYYLKYPRIPKQAAYDLISDGPITDAPIEKRYALYVYARQSGEWLNLISSAPDAFLASYSFQDQARIDRLPPVYFCHSIYDPDVPYAETQFLYNRTKNGRLRTSEIQNHEIDLDPDEQSRVISDALSFLKGIMPNDHIG